MQQGDTEGLRNQQCLDGRTMLGDGMYYNSVLYVRIAVRRQDADVIITGDIITSLWLQRHGVHKKSG